MPTRAPRRRARRCARGRLRRAPRQSARAIRSGARPRPRKARSVMLSFPESTTRAAPSSRRDTGAARVSPQRDTCAPQPFARTLRQRRTRGGSRGFRRGNQLETTMNARFACLGGAAVAAAFALGGCVSQGTYDKLEAEKAKEVGTLQAQRESLERERNALLEDKAALASDKSALERDRERLRAENEALEREKAKLLDAGRQTQAQYDKLVADLSQELKQGELQVRRYKDLLTVEVAEQLFFDSGRAALKDSGKAVLKKVADALKSYEDKAIRVVGHTDNVPISKAYQKVFPSNWELSSARATTVVRFLQEAGIGPERLVATGRAEYAPVAPNDSEAGRQKNRRIEITLVELGLVKERDEAR